MHACDWWTYQFLPVETGFNQYVDGQSSRVEISRPKIVLTMHKSDAEKLKINGGQSLPTVISTPSHAAGAV